MNTVDKIISEAFELYMPQVKSEITDLANLIQNDIFDKRENDPFYQYNILEIGTKNGGTFYIWNKLNELTNGMNISIDMSDGGLHGGISEEEMDKRDSWFNERFNNCHFIRRNSHDTITSSRLCEILFNKNWNDIDVWTDKYKQLDFLFIDGDHSYEGVKQDFLDYSLFCKNGSIICFHDIVISERHHERNVYVGEFWKEITKNKIQSRYGFNICDIDGTTYEFFEFIGSKDQDWAGIGILKKM